MGTWTQQSVDKRRSSLGRQMTTANSLVDARWDFIIEDVNACTGTFPSDCLLAALSRSDSPSRHLAFCESLFFGERRSFDSSNRLDL
jgi:hypothetical protein